MRATGRTMRVGRLAGLSAILAAGLIGCSAAPAVVPGPAAPPMAGSAAPLSEAHGTATTGEVSFSGEPMGGIGDNAAALPHDNTNRVIPFHKNPPPRQLPEPPAGVRDRK